MPAADVYRVVYRVDSVGSPWSVRFAYSESFDMTGLDQGTDYVSRVSARCPQGWTGYSVSAHGRFTTNSSVRDNGFIGEQEIELNVSLRPNPASDFATVEWSGKAGVAEVAVYDILGRKTSSYIQDEVKETGKLRLDLTGFPNGQYLIQVIAADKSIVKKLLVTK